ncbi:MAG: hypothetical protein ABJN40_15520 [Sneathiella sp.]
MKINPFLLTIILSIVALSNISKAATVIDIEQSDFTHTISDNTGSTLAQSFQASANNIAGAGVFVGAGTGTISISLFDALPSQGGAQLATGTASLSFGWVDAFWSPVQLTPSIDYFLVFEGQSEFLLRGQANDPYQGGRAFGDAAVFPDFDYAFRTYTETNLNAVPLPAALPLYGAGIAVLWLLGWRRKRLAHKKTI